MYGLDYLDWVTLCGNTSLTRYLVVGVNSCIVQVDLELFKAGLELFKARHFFGN